MNVPARHSLLRKIVATASIGITLLLAISGWFVQDVVRRRLKANLQEEIQGSLRAYESLWQARAESLRTVSRALSQMSDVRRAFSTNDRATIQDTASEIWTRVAQGRSGMPAAGTVFLVTDPLGSVMASLGGELRVNGRLDVVRAAAHVFPEQSDGFSMENGVLYELVVTPVYVQSQGGPALLNVLVAGFPVNRDVALDLRARTGSDFVFVAGGLPIASSLDAAGARDVANQFRRGSAVTDIQSGGREFTALGTGLRDLAGGPGGDLVILHDNDSIRRSLLDVELRLLLIGLAAVCGGVAVSWLLAKRILKPLRELEGAAAMISRERYGAQVPVQSDDELGRLAQTFNEMSASIQGAREELIRRERIATIGQLSTSIVHDLRNPLASIYGGAEMMMDGDLNTAQMQRVAGNIYRSSRAINEMLRELMDASHGREGATEPCRLCDVVEAAVSVANGAAAEHGVTIDIAVDSAFELPLQRARMERVFLNLISNAIEAMPSGGSVSISSVKNGAGVVVDVSDTGPGIPEAIRADLFKPFVTTSRNGLGLGLALSRQTVLDHGGDLWAERRESGGAHFRMRLPLASQ